MEQQQAKYEGIANALASRGRNGDSMMIHVSPTEVEYLEKIAPSLGINLPGGKLPINPDTGQPEAFPFLLGLLGALPAALSAAGGAAIGGTSIGTAVSTSLATSLAPLTGMFTGGLTGLSQGILGTTLTSALGLGGGSGVGTAGAASGALSGEALGTALGAGDIIAESAPALAEIGELGATAGELGTTAGELGATGLEGAFESLPSMIGETGLTGAEAGGLGTEAGASGLEAALQSSITGDATGSLAGGDYGLGEAAGAGAETAAAEAPSFMETVQSGLEAFGEDPSGTIAKGVGKAGEYALENPIKTAGAIYALDALTADDGGGGEGDPGETWASQQEGGDPFTYDQPGTGGGQMTPGRDLIADSGVPASMGAGVPSVVDQGLGSMPVGPDTAAPVGLGAAEMADIAGAEEAFDLMQDEGAALEDMSMDEIIASMPNDLTMEEIEALMVQFGGGALYG